VSFRQIIITAASKQALIGVRAPFYLQVKQLYNLRIEKDVNIMTKNLLLTTTNIINNIVSFLIVFTEFIIIAGSFVITILIVINIPSITEKEKKLENLSEREKETVITKAYVRWFFSMFFGSMLSSILFLYTKNLYFILIIGPTVSILILLHWLYINFRDRKKIYFLLNKIFSMNNYK
jgi:magnesium-transporting ATPase (P-type)